jgi:predicted XRE-type DNA-binding protein
MRLVDKLIIKLSILAKIPTDGKIKRDHFSNVCIDNTNYPFPFVASVRRYFHGDNRLNTVTDIGDIVSDCSDIIDLLIKAEIHDQVRDLCQSMELASQGITNLVNTYKSDASTISMLEMNITTLKKKAQILKELLQPLAK